MLMAVFLIALFGSLLLFVIFVAMQPAAFRITRSITMAAPPEAVFPHVNDFHEWAAWSPWEKIDPTMKKSYTGAPAGVGAVYDWDGNGKAGKGRMTLVESKPSDAIHIKIEFMKPMPATNAVEFRFVPQGNETNVTWNMTGTNGFVAKAFFVFMNIDKLVGADFEKGLGQLKTIVESPLQTG